ncbi:MAG: hypothetical protein IJS15_15770, partial [Victivallales bacterium]|nr:hypothetical protein [Victivallales bacterium]
MGAKRAVNKEDGLCAVVGANSSGGFTQGGLNWEASAIRQIEFRLKSNRPGYFRFNASCIIEGKRKFVSIDAISAMPDGEYRNYVYDCTGAKDWEGVVEGWELRWMGEEAEIGLKEMRTSPINNRLAFADSLTTGAEVRLQQLMPRAKCRIRWEGTRHGKACVQFYDREMRLLPETVIMQDATPVEFTTPEMMIYATLRLIEKGDGFPVVEQLEYVKPFTMPFGWRGYCIWSQTEPGPMNRRVWFKRVIELDEKPKYAVMAMGGDDRCYTYVNGKFMGRTSRWRDTGRYDITNQLKSGKNTILCSVHNDLSWGGFWGNVYIQTEKGVILADTDDQWTCDPDSNIDTALPQDISKPVCVLGPTNAATPWKGRMTLKFAGKRGAMEALSLRPGVMKVRILEEPLAIPRRLEFAIRQTDGQGAVQVIPIPITATSDNWKQGAEMEIM